MLPGHIWHAAPTALAVLVAACGGNPPPTTGSPSPANAPPEECRLGTGHASPADTMVVATLEPVDTTHAPVPWNDTERLLFRQHWDTLIRLDCTGAPRPGLAEQWSADSSGRAWTFDLRPATPELTATDVATTWQAREPAMAALRFAGLESLLPLDEHRLVVSFTSAHEGVPFVFADPALAIRREDTAGTFVLVRADAGRDPRDALDQGADLLLADDPTLLEYAASRADFTIEPLPWTRTYALVLPPGRGGVGEVAHGDSAAFRAALARDAVRADARGAEPPFWWDRLAGCGEAASSTASSLRSGGAVLYPRGDQIARDLAERLVALSDQRTTARGLDPDDFAAALRAGSERAFVVPLPRLAPVPCREAARWPAGARIVPLVDARRQAILRRGAPALIVDADGAIRR